MSYDEIQYPQDISEEAIKILAWVLSYLRMTHASRKRRVMVRNFRIFDCF